MEITRKKVDRIANQQRYDLRSRYFRDILCGTQHQDRSMFLFVDEIATDDEGYQRKRGWAPLGRSQVPSLSVSWAEGAKEGVSNQGRAVEHAGVF